MGLRSACRSATEDIDRLCTGLKLLPVFGVRVVAQIPHNPLPLDPDSSPDMQ
jgi:hypothetical protein